MLKLILVSIKLTLGYFAFVGKISLGELYTINILTVLLTYHIFNKLINFKTWLLAIIIIDSFIPILGFFSIAIFLLLSPFYKNIYCNISDDENTETSSFDEQFEKYIQIQQARVQKFEINSMQDKLFNAIRIQPYIDILLGHDTDIKLSVCIKITQFQTAQSIYLLKMALQDKEYEVRYMANNAIENIEKKLIDKIELLSSNIEKFPNMHSYYKERAYTYLTIFNLNILDTFIGKMFLERALNDLRHVILNEPEHFHTYINIAQIYTYLDMNNEVITLVEKALKLDMGDEYKTKLLYYRCEAYFKLKRLDLIIEDSKNIDISFMDFQKVKDSVSFWKEISFEQ